KDVSQDREEPGATVGSRIEAVKAAERSEAGFLDDVLGFRTIPRQPQGDVVERVEVDQGHPFELFRLAVPGLPADQALPRHSILTIEHRTLFPPSSAPHGTRAFRREFT